MRLVHAKRPPRQRLSPCRQSIQNRGIGFKIFCPAYNGDLMASPLAPNSTRTKFSRRSEGRHRSKTGANLNRMLQVGVSVTVLLVSALAWPQTPAASQPDQSERVDKVFQQWNRTDSPGCALSVMKDGRIVYKHGYGMADLDHNVTITPSTVLPGSCQHVETIYCRVYHPAPATRQISR